MEADREQLLNTISFNTIDFRIQAWIDNFKANLPRIHGGFGIDSLKETLTGVPCIVVGSGPTLDWNIDILRELQDKACIIACDSSLKALLNKGIKPHLTVCTDSKGRVAKYFADVDVSELTFILDSFVHPDTVEALSEGRIYWYNTLPVEKCPFTGALNRWTGYFGNLGTGGCVATTAWWFATQMLKTDPDVLVGMPEAIYDPHHMYAYCVKQTVEVEPYQAGLIQAVDFHGRQCYTYPALQSFAYWFQDMFRQLPGIHINCSEGGILRENVLNMPLSVCAAKYLRTEYRIEDLLFVKERMADILIGDISKCDLSEYKSMIMILFDGPSLPNLALRLGKTHQETIEAIGVLRSAGVDIDEQQDSIDIPDAPPGTPPTPIMKYHLQAYQPDNTEEPVNVEQPEAGDRLEVGVDTELSPRTKMFNLLAETKPDGSQRVLSVEAIEKATGLDRDTVVSGLNVFQRKRWLHVFDRTPDNDEILFMLATSAGTAATTATTAANEG